MPMNLLYFDFLWLTFIIVVKVVDQTVSNHNEHNKAQTVYIMFGAYCVKSV